ncbi:hypothetical protein Plhal304r1_c006g0023741 [Plasmopara halstedii]
MEFKMGEGEIHSKRNEKRLLPMELRKRRRAAKLLGMTEKKARVIPKAVISSSPIPTSTSSEEVKKISNDSSDQVISTLSSTLKAVNNSSTVQKSPRVKASAVSFSTRLHSLYNSSLLSKKAQRRLVIPGSNVPHKFKVAELPLDAVPKTKLSILTAMPFPFQRTTSKVKEQALRNMMMCNGAQSSQQVNSQNTAVRWQQALHYFAYPATQVPTSILQNRASSVSTSESILSSLKREHQQDEKTFFTTRWHTWQRAFHDVYMNFRRQSSSTINSDNSDVSFYLRSNEFVVHFIYEIAGCGVTRGKNSIIDLCRQHDVAKECTQTSSEKVNVGTFRAVMSQSSARIRKMLHHLNVAYTMPYIRENQTECEVGEFHLLEEESDASRNGNNDRGSYNDIAPVTSTSTILKNLHGADSLLLFYGHDAVHGLYEFLINRAPMSSQDVPELYALFPFANASIQSLRALSFGRVEAMATSLVSEEDQASRSAKLFRLEVTGFCFPSSIAKLIDVLRDEWEAIHTSYDNVEIQTGDETNQIILRTYMEAMAGAERLNAVKLDEQIASGFLKKSRNQEMNHKRQQALEFSKRRIGMTIATKMESHYNIQTTVRANV